MEHILHLDAYLTSTRLDPFIERCEEEEEAMRRGEERADSERED